MYYGWLKLFPKVFLILSTSHLVSPFPFRIDNASYFHGILRLMRLYSQELFTLKN